MAAVNPLFTVQQIQSLLFGLLARIHKPDDTGHHGIWPNKPSLTADTGCGTAKTVDTTGRLYVAFQIPGKDLAFTLCL